MPIDLSYIGRRLESVTHEYAERDLMLYALGVGCSTDELQFVYERDLKVLPTFAVIPSFPAMLNLGGAMQVNPALVLHGDRDSVIPYRLGQRLYEALPGPKQFVTLSCGEHNEPVPPDAEADWRAIKEFVATLRSTERSGRLK